MQGKRNLEQITKSVDKINSVSDADIRAVLYTTVDVITDDLAKGLIVRIGDLDRLRLSLSNEGFATEAEVTGNAVKNTKILVAPGTKLKQMQQTLVFEKT